MKRIISICIVLLLMSISAAAQPERIGVGLSFAEKIDFNYNTGVTGNPGLNVKTWINLDKRQTMSIVPSITAYNPHTKTPNTSAYFTKTYLFHGDLDFQYRIFRENTLTVVGMAGLNYSHIITDVIVSEQITGATNLPQDSATFGIGPNIGAGLEMRMGSQWDFNVSAKYAFPGLIANAPGTQSVFNEDKPKLLSSPLTALVIQVHAVYYFKGRNKGFRR